MKVNKIIAAFTILLCCFSLSAADYRYHYDLLDSESQALYTRMSDSIELLSYDLQDIPGDFDGVDKVFRYLLLDNPRFFYTRPSYSIITNTRNGVPYRYDFKFDYEGLDEINTRAQQLSFAINWILGNINTTDSQYDYVKDVYEYLGKNIDYDENYPDQSMYSVLVNSRGVCAGVADAFSYLMSIAEIPCITVTGWLENERHSWNMVQISGRWYHVDVTSSFSLKDNPEVFYSFLCISDTQIKRTHLPDTDIPLPSAIREDLEYFNLNGLKMNRWSTSDFIRMLKKAKESGKQKLSIKFGSKSEFDDAKATMSAKSKIFSYYKEAGIKKSTIEYSFNNDFLVLTLSL